MKTTSTPTPKLMNASSRVCSIGGRVLILLTGLLFVATPWTEYFWHFDNFLHGGQDMELGLLSIVTVFCLVLVLLRDGKEHMWSKIAIWQLAVFVQADAPTQGISWLPNAAVHTWSPPTSSLDIFNLPIQI